MAAKLDAIRKAADRVAASHGLDVVEVEFAGGAKDRILRVYLEKNAAGRAELKAQIQAQLAQQVAAKLAAQAQASMGASTVDAPEIVATPLPERFFEESFDAEHLAGITHEDCERFSRDFGTLLDVEEWVAEGEYTLEVSSPGLDRKLTKPEEFHRFHGSLVKVRTLEPIAKNRHWQGRLIASSAESITLDLAAGKQNSKSRKAGVSTVEIALANMERAQLVPEF